MLPFDKLQQRVKEQYYRRRGMKLYSDFKTFGSSDRIAKANAIDFYAWLAEYDDGSEHRIYDFGIGNGLFSKYFIEHVRRLDKRREFLPRLRFFLCDISEKLLRNAEKAMRGLPVEAVQCNALGSLKFLKGASYVRSNEMYDDLPARIYVKRDGVFEVLADERMNKEYRRARASLGGYPQGYEVPVNYGAEKHLATCVKSLRKGGYVDIFDYGFSSIAEMRELPAEMWNNSIVREFNSQLTIDVNFLRLAAPYRKSIVRPQKAYAEKTLGEKLYYVEAKQLHYMSRAEFVRALPKLGKFGYSRDFLSSGITETDDYKHLRVWK